MADSSMDNDYKKKLRPTLNYYRFILLGLTFVTVSFDLCTSSAMRARDQSSNSTKSVRHYAANLASEGFGKDDIEEALKDKQLDQQIKTVYSTLTALFHLNANIMFVDMSDVRETGKNFAVAVEDISHDFPELSAKYPDGTILLAKELVEDKFLREGLRMKESFIFGGDCSAPKELGLVKVNGIIAHELAHLLQKKKNCPLRDKGRELNADFLAGWALTNRVIYGHFNLIDLCKKNSSDSALASSKLFDAFGNLGDDHLVRNSYVTNPHGVSEERYRTIKSGSGLAGRDLDMAYEESVLFVSNARFVPLPLASLDGIFESIRGIVGSDRWRCSWGVLPMSTMNMFPPTFTSKGCQMTVEQRRSIDARVDGKDIKDDFLPPIRASAEMDTFDLTNVSILSLKEVRKLPYLGGVEATGLPDTWYEIRLGPIPVPPSRYRPTVTLIVPTEEIARAATAKLVSAIKVCQSNVDSHALFESRQ